MEWSMSTKDGQLRKIGGNQLHCLRTLRDRGDYPGRWQWDNRSTTVRILEGLVRKGLAETYEVTRQTAIGPQVTTCYRITENGRTYLSYTRRG